MAKDAARDKKIRLYQNRMYLTGLYNPDDINIEDKELAYIAGLFDGEVALHISHQKNRRNYSLSMTYMKANYDILKYISNLFGGTVTQVKPQPCYKSKFWRWYIGAGNAYRVLRKLYPFLRIKQEAAAICIEFFESYWQGRLQKFKPVSDRRQEIGAHYKTQLEGYQSKPGTSHKSQSLHKKIKRRGIIYAPPMYTQERVTPNSPHHPNILLPELELAYIAGLLDAESSFIIYKLSNRPSYLLEVNYRKTDRDTLQYLADIFGGRVRLASHSTENTLDVWLWKLVSADAYSLIKHIYPFLRVKRRAAEICMEFFELYWQWGARKSVSLTRQAIGLKYAAMLRLYHTKSVPHRRK
jgi:hypothetical protein